MFNSGSRRDLSDAKIPGPSGLGGGLPDYSNTGNPWLNGASGNRPNYDYYLQQTPAARSSIPEDSARSLFQTLYDALVYATSEDRRKAVLMLVAAYDLPV